MAQGAHIQQILAVMDPAYDGDFAQAQLFLQGIHIAFQGNGPGGNGLGGHGAAANLAFHGLELGGDAGLTEIIQQAGAEYARRLDENGLQSIVRVPDENVAVWADGKYVWRILDNLLSNVCKYAMPNTRVYLEVRAEGENAVFSVKNMSRESLNITAEELMERFVRGDASRNTEGSGLGLSIAQSLAKLMGGSVQLTVDGDLFKAEVVLPLAK